MILKYSHCEIRYNRHNKINKSCFLKKPIFEVECEKCNKLFTEKSNIFEKRLDMINKNYCGKCSRPLMASLNALKGVYDENGNLKPNSGRFSTERVKSMTPDEYAHFCKQRKHAAKSFHKKLSNDAKLYENHYKKVFKGSNIGYISKGQRDIHSILEPYGFELEKLVHGIKVDIANVDKKIAIEYYGDYFHANPRKYAPDYYLKVSKMTAIEKWNKDRKRNFHLRNLGWTVLIIWENSWENDRRNVIDMLGNHINENFTNINTYDYEFNNNVKSKLMNNLITQKNKYVSLNEVDEHLNSGWVMGYIRRKK